MSFDKVKEHGVLAVFSVLFFVCAVLVIVNYQKNYPSYEKSECLKSPTVSCVRKIILEGRKKIPDKEIVKKSEILGLDIAVLKKKSSEKEQRRRAIAVQAKKYPEQVADFSFFEKANDLKYLAYDLIAGGEGYEGIYYPFRYYLGEGKKNPYKSYLYKTVFENFQPNATWFAVLKAWEDAARQQSGVEQSRAFVNIAKLEYETGRIDKAVSMLEMVTEHDALTIGYFYLLRKALAEKGKHLKISIPQKHENRFIHWHAYEMVFQGKVEEAIRFYHDKVFQQDLFSAKARYMSRQLYETGETQKAYEFAKSVLSRIEEMPLTRVKPLQYYEWSKLYREIGQADRAAELMRPLSEAPQEGRYCGRNAESLIKCAVEFVHLGFSEVAYKTVFEFCLSKKRKKCGSIADFYIAAHETGAPVPSVDRMLDATMLHWGSSLFLKIAAFHYGRKEKELGDATIENLVRYFDYNKGAGGLIGDACGAVLLINFTDRKDLLEPLFQKAVKSIYKNIEKPEYRLDHYTRLVECFVGSGAE